MICLGTSIAMNVICCGIGYTGWLMHNLTMTSIGLGGSFTAALILMVGLLVSAIVGLDCE